MNAEQVTRTRRSAEERREEIIELAIRQFALGGYKGSSTDAIARAAGISQPYLFRLFKTKRELFLACCDAADARIVESFRAAAQGVPKDEVLAAMGRAYVELLGDRIALLFQMQSYAACSDPVIQAHVRASYGELVREVTRLSGAPPEQVWQFFSHGMLLNVIASLDLAAVAERT
jgi:AcrR family transcriptional regulator